MSLIKNALIATAWAALMSTAAASHAEIITFAPDNGTVAVGDTIEVKLVGREFTAGTFGGGVSIAWDPALLSLESYDTSVFPGDKSLSGTGANITVLDSAAGTLTNLNVNSLLESAAGPDFDIAVLTFKGLSAGQSALQASLGQFASGLDNVWTDGGTPGNPIEPQFVAGSLDVTAVPVPAAVWLFGSALLGGVGMLRRQRG